jgi:hypothetical protein
MIIVLCFMGILILFGMVTLVFEFKPLLHLEALITGNDLIYLQDHDGTITLTIRRKSPFGGYIAQRFLYSNTKTVTLNDDGSVSNGGYVERWVLK